MSDDYERAQLFSRWVPGRRTDTKGHTAMLIEYLDGPKTQTDELTRYTDDTVGLRRAFAKFPSGVAAVSALVGDKPVILVASSFTVGVSEDPPLVLFAVRKASATWQLLQQAPALGISVLGEQLAHSVRQLAGSDVSARLNGIDSSSATSGAVFLDHSTMWLECAIENMHPAGDHDIVVLRVAALRSDFDKSPLIWHSSGFTTLVSSRSS